MNYYYSPFLCQGYETQDQTLRNERERYRAKGAHIINWIWPGTFLLMQPTDVLLINGHCATDKLTLHDNQATTGPGVGIGLIAQWLRYGCLRPDHVRIRFVACESIAIAQYFALEIGKDHHHIAVGGYVHSIVGLEHNTRHLILDPMRYPNYPRNTRDSGYVRWYGMGGVQLQGKPRPDGQLGNMFQPPPPPPPVVIDEPQFNDDWMEFDY